ncbi:MAG: LysM peptidoglycan-binding domain-containing protein [Anaerolineae bacterium]|nr:LysM peptidoglycan-binding domain-containing protein [Anaerolineae bacterium]
MVTQIHRATQVHRRASRPRPKRGLPARLLMGGMTGLGLCLIAAVIAIIAYALRGNLSVNDRPLVLIHSPLDREQLSEGDGVLVHATARSADGIQCVELWADDVLVAQRQAEQGDLPISMVLSADWVPTSTGNHRLIVRATAANDAEGQSSITIETAESDEPEPADTHTVQEGETLTTIADEYGATAEDLAASNPGLDPSGPAPGDELVIPSGEPPSEGSPPLTTDEDAPPHVAESPAPLNLFFGVFSTFEIFGNEDADPTGLRMELISLTTPMVYETLNCYVGLAGQPPLRYPDMDGDQSTDESFSIMDGVGGDGASWDVGEYLSGDSLPSLFWPGDQSLPFDIACVGITGGGTQALQLGHTEMEITPEDWDGIVRYADVAGAEGSYTIGYRVSRIDYEPHGEPKGIDPDMTPPTDLIAGNYIVFHGPDTVLEDGSDGTTVSSYTVTENDPFTLLWHYNPRPDEAPISGFRIYLNRNLQWTEGLDRRYDGYYYTVFPPQWGHPPCGESYTLTVSAWRPDSSDPDGLESPPADRPIIFETPDDECERWVAVTFNTLETFELGGDGHYEHRTGDVGPPYGYFWANSEYVSFDTGSLGDNFAPVGLLHNSLYSLSEMAANPNWGFGGRPYFVVAVPEGRYLDIGFHISDEDDGRCRHSGDPGCDDVICEGAAYGLTDLSYYREGALMSDNGRCRVSFTRRPAFGSPIEASSGEPLPWIFVDKVEIDEGSGAVRIHVRNTGTAAWTMHDLQIDLQTRNGESLGRYIWPNFYLDVGEHATLGQPTMRVDVPYDACVVVDPNDAVREEYEVTGALFHLPECPLLPDLRITNISYDGLESLIRVTVRNIGDGPLEGRTLSLNTRLSDGSPLDVSGAWRDVSLAVNQIRSFNLPVTESDRARMRGGYTVLVNEGPLFAESNTSNNGFTVSPARQLQLYWCNRNIPHVDGLSSAVHMDFTADIISGGASERVLDSRWSHSLSGQEVIWGYDHNENGFPSGMYGCDPESGLFEIAGDQWLRVNFHATYRRGSSGDFDNIGSAGGLHSPWNNWDAGIIPHEGASFIDCTEEHSPHALSYDFGNAFVPATWYTRYLVCQLER